MTRAIQQVGSEKGLDVRQKIRRCRRVQSVAAEVNRNSIDHAAARIAADPGSTFKNSDLAPAAPRQLIRGRQAGRATAEHDKGGLFDLHPIRHAPDHAGLIGSIHLVPAWILAGHDSILAVDIGGSNIRAGIVEFHSKKKKDLSDADVHRLELWRHSDDAPKREDAVERLIEFLLDLVKRADKDGLTLAPFIGIGCPGVIRADGSIERGGQNLPGNWEAKGFNLPQRLREALPTIGDHDTVVLMHNDAVVQGLSELPWMQDVKHWAVMTIGTGLGNAHFTNRALADQ